MFNRPTKEYLDSLKVGDEITYLIRERWEPLSTPITIKVVRRTPKQIVFHNNVGVETRYRAEDGMQIGAGYGFLPRQATEEEISEARTEIRRYVLARKLKDVKYSGLTLAELEQIKAIIDHHIGKTK
jgi:hypothetical protein